MERSKEITNVSPHKLKGALEGKDACQIIDVREYAEVRTEYIEGTTHTPLSSLEEHIEKLEPQHTTYILCKSGNRAKQAAEKLKNEGYQDIKLVEGGLDAWKKAGFDIKQGESQVWSLERQVRFSAGFIVFAGLVLANLFHPSWALVSAGIALGLMFSAITNTCGMGMMLSKMPWNQN